MRSENLSKLVGRLLEIKCPNKRKINTTGSLDGDICPHYYFVQVQTQLYVTQMDECDFLQCQIEEYDSWEDFKLDSNPIIPGLSKQSHGKPVSCGRYGTGNRGGARPGRHR